MHRTNFLCYVNMDDDRLTNRETRQQKMHNLILCHIVVKEW